MKYYIIWNEAKTEGFITVCLFDALQTRTGEFDFSGHSAIGKEFHDAYEDDQLTIQEVEL